MHLRSLVLVLTVLAIAALAALNWPALAAPTLVSLGVVVFDAPLGLIMLGLTVLLGIFFLAYVLSLQGSVLLETLYIADCYRDGKDLRTARESYDRAIWDGVSPDELEARLVDLAGFMGGLARNRFEMWGITPEGGPTLN